MARRKKVDRKKHISNIADTLIDKAPLAVKRLCEILEDEDTSSSTALSAAKEILERSVGKGVVTELEESEQEKEIVIILKVVE